MSSFYIRDLLSYLGLYFENVVTNGKPIDYQNYLCNIFKYFLLTFLVLIVLTLAIL